MLSSVLFPVDSLTANVCFLLPLSLDFDLIFFLVPKPWVMFGLGNGLDQWSNGPLHGDSILYLPFLHLAFSSIW